MVSLVLGFAHEPLGAMFAYEAMRLDLLNILLLAYH